MNHSKNRIFGVTAASFALVVLFSAPLAAEKQGDGTRPHGKMHHKMWSKMDSDGDRRISRDEFVNFQTERFDKMDSNGDNFVDAEELKTHHQKMKKKFKEAFERRQQELTREE
ncbi:MAG: hypothetical protein VW985_04445 [Gammaproteobacteria bacterium]